jgi:hypothetical protein
MDCVPPIERFVCWRSGFQSGYGDSELLAGASERTRCHGRRQERRMPKEKESSSTTRAVALHSSLLSCTAGRIPSCSERPWATDASWEPSLQNALASKLVAEFIATFALVFIGAGAAAVRCSWWTRTAWLRGCDSRGRGAAQVFCSAASRKNPPHRVAGADNASGVGEPSRRISTGDAGGGLYPSP